MSNQHRIISYCTFFLVMSESLAYGRDQGDEGLMVNAMVDAVKMDILCSPLTPNVQ